MNRRRWWALVLVAIVVCGVMGPEVAVADMDENHASAGQGTWPEKHQRSLDYAGDELPEGTWRDGWCRRGEQGYTVVIDYSHEPPERRGVLTAAHTREFGPTAADGWIVRCYEGPLVYKKLVYKKNTPVIYEGDAWDDVIRLVGLYGQRFKNYVYPPGTDEVSSARMTTDPQILGLRRFAKGDVLGPIHQWNGGVWIRPDADGGWANGWPKSGTPRNGPWPSSADNRLLPVSDDGGVLSGAKPPAGSILYVAFGDFGASKDCKRPVEYFGAASPYICLGEAALHPKTYRDPQTHQPCPGWTLTPQFSDGTVNGCVPKNPRPRPSTPTGGPTRDPGSGNGPHPRRPRHVHKPTPPVRPHPGQHRAGVGGALGRDGTPHHGVFHRNAHKDVHAGDRVSSQVRKAARTPSPSAPPSTSATPSVSASPSPSVSPSATSSPSVSAGVVVSPSPGDGRVWGSEQQGPPASDGARRRVPGWAWGAGAGVLVAAGVVAWWMTRGRRRDREDDEVGTDLFE